MFWLWEGYNNGYFKYDTQEVIGYCKKELGFEYDDGDPEGKEYDEAAEYEAFYEWKDDYVHNVLKTDDEVRDFFYDVLKADPDEIILPVGEQ